MAQRHWEASRCLRPAVVCGQPLLLLVAGAALFASPRRHESCPTGSKSLPSPAESLLRPGSVVVSDGPACAGPTRRTGGGTPPEVAVDRSDEAGETPMTIGPENFGNGAAKTEDRFTGYRPRSGRDGSPALGGSTLGGSGLAGSMLSGDAGTDELAPRNGGSSLDRLTTPLEIANP